MYNPASYAQNALTFRHNGPRARFDHHRPPPESPEEDPDRGVWYGAPLEQPAGGLPALEVCAWECFGAERRIELSFRLGRVRVSVGERLRLLSLIDGAAIRAGTVAQIAATPNAEDSQAWSRFFYESESIYGMLDGLLYRSAWTGGLGLALYERAKTAIVAHAGISSLPLYHPLLEGPIAEVAERNGWSIATADLLP
jgi:hypothetical protein